MSRSDDSISACLTRIFWDKKVQKLNGDKRYPRVEYSSRDATVTIYTALSTLHANAADVLQMCIFNGVRAALDSHGKGELGNRFRGVRDRTCNTVHNELRESVKIPDAGLVYRKPGSKATFTVVIEVGVSESCHRLKADVNVWMQDFRCRTVILFLLKEQPKFKCPRKAAMRAYVADDGDTFDNAIYQVRDNQPFGPYLYNTHSWFGTLDTAFVEIYRRDPNTGVITQPNRKYVTRDGRMELTMPIWALLLTICFRLMKNISRTFTQNPYI
ncbi:hypothetical protein V1524DRAFT_440881 [Lipomyces starkeyi]